MSIFEEHVGAWLQEFRDSHHLDTSAWKTRAVVNGCCVSGIATYQDAMSLGAFLREKSGCDLQTKRAPDRDGWILVCTLDARHVTQT